MPEFLNPALLTLGLPLLALPIVIHLINMMRHRKVQWAAMEFLLESQKKNSTWILLKQLLLLLLRMLAVAAIVMIVAQPLMHDAWGRLLGGTKTHHIVLLDDSFSMSDQWEDRNAFDRGKQFIVNLGTQAARYAQPQTFTLMRFSRGGSLAKGRPPDLLEEIVNTDLVAVLESKLRTMQTSQTAAGPLSALESVTQLLGEAADENRIVYVVSDFRAREWDDATSLKKTLSNLSTAGAQLRLIPCVDSMRANLGITSLEPLSGTRAAGVPLFMQVSVTNHGSEPARQVAIALAEDENPRAGEVIESIPPGGTETRRFLVQFRTAGEHRVTATLESDAVAADNEAFAVVDFPVGVPVLIIDGDAQGRGGFFLTTALNPGNVRTGITPQVELPRYLDNNPLEKFHTIYLCNVDRLNPPGIDALEQYVKSGGGVAFFMGDLSDGAFYTGQLYRDGEGLFPLPLASPTELLINRLEKTVDLEVGDHPVFRVFAGERNSFLADVTIQRYFAAPNDWKPPQDSTVRIMAQLRNAAPLAVEHKYGDGRVVAMLTTAGPDWNNWANNSSYVIAMHELQAYLASARPVPPARQVATPLELRLDPAIYQPQVRFLMPDDPVGGGVPVDASPDANGLAASYIDTDQRGVYRVELSATDGTKETRQFAYNVVPDEGNLAMMEGAQLAERLTGVPFEYQPADTFEFDGTSQAGFNLSEGILYLMILLLIGEQVLAYLVSYHPPAQRGAA